MAAGAGSIQTADDFFLRRVTIQIKAVADKYAEGRIVSVLEGGYNLSALARGVVAHIKVLGGL